MSIWIANPFDEPPRLGVTPLRYAALAEALTSAGHRVVWWSCDWSHLNKAARTPAADAALSFQVRLIPVRPYRRHVSLRRWLSHRDYARGLKRLGEAAIASQELPPPDVLIASLPPLGVLNTLAPWKQRYRTRFVLDLMDAWPETFYRLLPRSLRSTLGPLLFAPGHASARRAYQLADRISGVGQGFLNRAIAAGFTGPTHLCYHGTDLKRFAPAATPAIPGEPLQALYLGAMNRGYDLDTLITVADCWKKENRLPWRIHLAGNGDQVERLKARCSRLGLGPDRIRWHGYLDAAAVATLMQQCHLGLVLNRPDTLVCCPYKAAEYAAAGLPMITCLGGEFASLLTTWRAGTVIPDHDPAALAEALDHYAQHPATLREVGQQSRYLAEAAFDRRITYRRLAEFMLGGMTDK
jgi:glycosyltransferase involved in cell wall biosynthesis